jgi:hypothetical protein
MSTRAASILATILSLLLLLIFAVLAVIFELIALNGASESQGMQAIGISLACLGTGAILLGVLAWKATAFLIQKFNLNHNGHPNHFYVHPPGRDSITGPSRSIMASC